MRNFSRLMVAAGALLTAGTAEAQSQQPYFGRYYGFGDSLTDNGRVLRETGYDPAAYVGTVFFGAPGIYQAGQWGNLPGFFNLVPGKIGITNDPANDFAVGGATSVHQAPAAPTSPFFDWGLPDQIDTFVARVGRFAPNDLINLWIGYNDLTGIPAAAPKATKTAAVQGIVNNTTNSISRMASLGGRQFVVFNQQTFRASNSDAAATLNAMLPGALAPLSASGLNVHLFDVEQLVSRLRANPAAYGFAANAGTVSCRDVPSCAANGATTGQENLYISPEGIHFTGATNVIISNFLANQLNAPFTTLVQADMAQSVGVAFSSSLLSRLDAYHFSSAAGSPSNAYAMYTKAPPKQSPEPYGPWSIFAMGSYVRANEKNQVGIPAYGNDLGAGTVGFDYRWSRNLLLGGAFSYSDSNSEPQSG